MESITILSLMPLTEDQLRRLHAVSPRLDIHLLPEGGIKDLPDTVRERVEVMFGSGPLIQSAEGLPALKWLQVSFAGIDGLVDKPIWHTDVHITNASGIHATPIAERTMAMMLAFRARLPELWRYQQHKAWPQDRYAEFGNPGLRGSVLGIAGYGAIGGELARVAQALGMRVLGMNRTGQRHSSDSYVEPGTGDPGMQIPETMYAMDGFYDMLPLCDHVVALAPLTPETYHMFDAAAFTHMKPSACFYNFGRGPLTDEPALIAALQTGKIAGAGLDVYEKEPLPAESPLWGFPNVIISPHVGGMNERYNDRATDLFAANLARYLSGQTLFNLVDRQRGY